MDVYGFPPYSLIQSDELPNQAFPQQPTVAPSIPFPNRDTPEPHVMPVPTGAPWNVQGISWGMSAPPDLVQFTAPTRQAIEQRDGRLSPVIHCKRKSLDVEPVIPAKQRITEDKMAAHLNSLHISSDYTTHSLAIDDTMDVNMEPSTSNSTAEKLKGHTIVLSEEIKKMCEEPLLPASLIEILEKPRMSLVVWKPREDILGTLKEDERQSEDDKSQRRNGVLVIDSQQVLDDFEM